MSIFAAIVILSFIFATLNTTKNNILSSNDISVGHCVLAVGGLGFLIMIVVMFIKLLGNTLTQEFASEYDAMSYFINAAISDKNLIH
ncbi:hypothetical protein AGMMS49975_25570 [Clostridia bacterium]|nr:hypothetical protein AGMMS49975_25570 [Clostridia bacterium]